MLTIKAVLKCDYEDCKQSVDVICKLSEERLMDGALGDHYPTFMRIMNPPPGWQTDERKYAGSFCPEHLAFLQKIDSESSGSSSLW